MTTTSTTTTTSIPCPTCLRGTSGSVRSTFRAARATITPCVECAMQGITQWTVRQTDVARYLAPEPTPVRHADGLVWLGR